MADFRHTDRRPRPLLRTVVGEVLRRRRQEQCRTLAEVARDANVSVQYLSEVERGRKEPSSEILAAVCDSLRIELADLLAEVRQDLTAGRAAVLSLDPARSGRAGRVQAPIPNRPGRRGDVMLLAA
ncbi:helix-turn-helix domain-containing protein [Jidongwangia harbinensis]|uniref:helix-turn-helix domain-containing protein n=1 Tax=Jidongwangia harbinensis TaxID=2878561 RepID=UPI001CD9C343|nr:helix-turn-helix transcriptional regulator [Jidongwangia harbinensis]MCA2211605.1 helix-turn-helix domain-containing protein [Jidongwangia harbinensis]